MLIRYHCSNSSERKRELFQIRQNLKRRQKESVDQDHWYDRHYMKPIADYEMQYKNVLHSQDLLKSTRFRYEYSGQVSRKKAGRGRVESRERRPTSESKPLIAVLARSNVDFQREGRTMRIHSAQRLWCVRRTEW